MRALPRPCLALLLALSAPAASAGSFAPAAADLWGAPDGAEVRAPDGRKAIVLRPPPAEDGEANHTVTVRVGDREFPTPIGRWVNAQAAWSADARAFFVNYSDGGDVGTYHLVIFEVGEAGVRMHEPLPDGCALWRPRSVDDGPECPNLAAVKWLRRDGSRLLVVAAAPDHSSCLDMGRFRAYELDVPSGRIVRSYDEAQARRRFAKELPAWMVKAADPPPADGR